MCYDVLEIRRQTNSAGTIPIIDKDKVPRVETGVPGDFGMVCLRKQQKSQRRKRQKVLIIDLFLDFAKNTTLHGLRYVTEIGLSAVEKIFWIITFIISVVLCFMLIERVWHKWWYSPVIVSFNEKMIPVGEVPFPSVTICPQWKCKKSEYDYTKQLKSYHSSKSKAIKRINIEEGETEKLEDAMLVCDDKNRQYFSNRNVSDATLVNNIYEIAPQHQDIFPGMCRWRGTKNSCSEMFRKVLTNEGVCYNFNALAYSDIFRNESVQNQYLYLNSIKPIKDWDIASGYSSPYSSPKKSESYPRRGQENGVQPDLDFILSEEPENSDDMCNSLYNGFKIYLQHPADMPQSTLYYYAAIPGQVTSLALKFTILNTAESLMKYRSDQRQCYFPKDRQLKYFKTYTPSNCRLECLSIYTYRRCNCVWFHMPHTNSSELCTLSKRKCVARAQDELASNSLKVALLIDKDICNCLPSCDSIQYDAEILKTNFDFKKNRNAMLKFYGYNGDSWIDSRNFSRVELYFKEPRFVSMRRSELFGLTDFLANCGGLLGLFLGFSVLSVVEIFYFCTLRLWYTLKRDIKIEKKQLKESMYKK